jgi:hypothetical protein
MTFMRMLSVLAVALAVAAMPAFGQSNSQPAPKSDPPAKAGDEGKSSGPAGSAQSGSGAGSDTAKPSTSTAPPQKWYSSLRPDDLIGKDLRDKFGEDVTDIDGIVMEPSSKKLFAVVSVGGVFGIGAKDVVVPLDDIQRAAGTGTAFSSTVSEEELKQLPEYDAARYTAVDRGKQLSAATS